LKKTDLVEVEVRIVTAGPAPTLAEDELDLMVSRRILLTPSLNYRTRGIFFRDVFHFEETWYAVSTRHTNNIPAIGTGPIYS